ncbi:hypothetical protein H6P81_003886 [Aristolochia fimbriata]|uniref:EGF-like domain-containing protein n=1 Tax=Aristolochia fimbriata TaxID=158543 RepID=A0AAV7FHJ8_ARIFI|nr:hypothetical protein H6P81_003886 [Aristolochia fimbriata]
MAFSSKPFSLLSLTQFAMGTPTSALSFLVAVSVFQTSIFLGNFVPPVSPNLISDIACKFVDCGFGNCTEGSGLIPFECVCKPGWKQIAIGGGIVLPPCIIPNCTLDFNCANAAPSPAPPHPPVFNLTDPCSYTLCGEGTCVRTGKGYRCDCNKGSANLLNMTGLPCFRECVFGGDCSGLGFGITHVPPPPPPPPPTTSNSGSTKEKSFSGKQQVVSVLMLVAMLVPWF